MTDTNNTNRETIFFYYPIPILLSFSLSFVLPSVINLFKKNIHSFFNLTTTTTTTTTTPQIQSHSVSGLSLATMKAENLPNILESTMLNLNSSIAGKSSPASIGFVAGDVDDLMSCNESLGFESSNRIDINEKVDDDNNNNDEIWRKKMMMKKAESRANWMRSFPPLISSLNRNGKPSFYLRPVRKDGRLELTEVRIQPQEILHASRHDGRLTMHLIPDQDQEEDEEDEEQEEQEQEKLEVVEEKEEEDREIPMVVGNNNEGLRRCHEMVNQHHHHHHHHVHGNDHIRMCGISIV